MFTRSPGQGLEHSGPEAFHLILDMTPFQSSRFALQALGAARCNIFRCCQLEVGSLWLPVMQDGRECFGIAALRPKEFTALLDRIATNCEHKVRAACG